MLRWGALLFCAAALQAQSRGVWESRAPFPLALTEVSAAALDDEVHVICGMQANGLRSNRHFVYDTAADAWSERAPLPIQLGADHCNFSSAQGKLYFTGGIRLGAGFLTPQTIIYDPASNSWFERERMAVARGASGAAVLGGKIYVAGGEGAQLSGQAFEAFDIQTELWAVLPNLPEPRTHLTAQAVGGKFYAIGGRLADGSVRGDVFEYDPAGATWRRRAPMPTPRAGIASGVIEDKIIVFGGEGPSGRPEGTYAQVEEYDPAANAWRSLEPMPNPRHGFYGATVSSANGDAIYLPGGGLVAGLNVSQVHDVFYLSSGAGPALSAAGIVNAASFEPRLAPGSIAALFALELASGEDVATALPLPTRLAGLAVRIDGRPAPLYFASPGQANLLIPLDAAGQIQVSADDRGAIGNVIQVALTPAAPALFTMDRTGTGQAAALIAGFGVLAGSYPGALGRRARRGEVLEIYATGLGQVDHPPAAGAGGPSSPLARTLTMPMVRIGGAEAQVLYSGLAPALAGVYQVNAEVPVAAPSGDAVELTLEILGESSQTGATVGVE
jgi:uncharacterized protein (TIGR03437 family)